MKGLVLSGGGARGAYQVGVLNAIADISAEHKIKSPVDIYTGVSAGAINAIFMSAGADDFSTAAKKLADLWSGLTSDRIFRTDAVSLGKIGLKWVGELSFGSITGTTLGKALLDTAPLYDLIRDNMDFSKVQKHIDNGVLKGVGITALDYHDSEAITFVQAYKECPMWVRSRRHSEKAILSTEHIMASSAIPMLFPPVQVENRYFGDGCVRNLVPCSPALHMGASKILVVGVRRQEEIGLNHKIPKNKNPSVARVINLILNAVLLDGVEVDIERLKRVNDFIKKVPTEHQEALNFKPVDYVYISPSEDIGEIASSMSSRMPRVIRYLLKGLGPIDDAQEIVSYLLFEKDFCTRLIEMGYKDGMAQKAQIEQFLLSK